jgi:transcriptional regulator with XRE-family HTH domain
LDPNHVGQIERGELVPTLKNIELIALALKTRPSELVAMAERLANG